MMQPQDNDLLRSLPRSDRARLALHLAPVPLASDQVIVVAGQTTRHVYFPTRGSVSLVTGVDRHPGLGIGMIGNEGMLGAHVALGQRREPHTAIVQVPGTAWRMLARPFRSELSRDRAMRRAVQGYLFALLGQRAAAAGCMRHHEIRPRLARWLLMTQDRAHADSFTVTQAFLADMLGVRRVGITAAAGDLQRRGLIQYRRGMVRITDRAGLEAASCSCYVADRRLYGEAMGLPPGRADASA